MYRTEKLRSRFREFKGEIKGLFKPSDTTNTGSNTPPDTSPHSTAPSQPGLIDGSGTSVLREVTAEASIKELVTGFIGTTADVLKLGPLQSIADMLQAFADMYQLEGILKEEHKELQQRLWKLLNVVQNHSHEDISPVVLSKIKETCVFIEGELNAISKNSSGKRHGRLLIAKDEESRFIASCRRIQEYMEQLSLDTTLSMWKLEAQQSNDRVVTLIRSLPSLPAARYDSIAGQELKRTECTPGTRISVLTHLHQWASSNNVGGICWLNGMAGTGKTTIAYSVCKALHTEGKLGASFFCSRLRQECRDVNVIVPSIAYQLAQCCPVFRCALSTVLEKEPEAHAKRLDMQFELLIERPLLFAKPSLPEGLVVVIDALDECENEESTRNILEVLIGKAEDIPIRFIISSRPEQQIRNQMTDKRVQSKLVLHELDTGEVQTDIETYLRKELEPMQPPPTDAQIAALVERTGILFIYAATAVRYIGYQNFRRNPSSRLQTVLDGPRAGKSKHHEEVDQLYKLILGAALDDQRLDEDEKDDMRQVLHSVICAREPLTIRSLSELLQINDIDRVRAALQPLYSVLHVVGDAEMVTTLHASFSDFMFDSTRSKTFWCDSNSHHCKLAGHCFEFIARTPRQVNICGLESSYLPDRMVPDINSRVTNSISPELLYACRYWADHIKTGDCASSVMDQLHSFLSSRLLLWMEVLNLANRMKAGMECVKLITKWSKSFTERQELIELAHDAKRFVEAFASNPVSQGTPHIYLSMLAFWPKSAPITKHYAKYARGPVEVEGTALDRRQLAHLSTWAFEQGVEAIAVSPDGLYMALAAGKKVLVVDSSSGRAMQGSLEGHPSLVRAVAFSPDGSRIFAASTDDKDMNAIILGWDTRNGDTVLGPLQLHGHTDRICHLSFSPDCSRIATDSHDNTVRLWDTENGKILHRMETRDTVEAAVFSPDGTQIVAKSHETLHRWSSHPGALAYTPVTHIGDIRMADSVVYLVRNSAHLVHYSPDQSHLIAVGSRGQNIYVWDALSGNLIRLIESPADRINCIDYSPDGRFIVSGSQDGTIRVWDTQSGDMILGPLESHTSAVIIVMFSPDGSRIISACTNGLVCTWDAQQHNLAPSSTSAPSDRITCAKFSDGARFVSGSEEGAISTWDAHTGGMILGPVKVHTKPIYGIDFKSGHVLSHSADGKVCVRNVLGEEILLDPLGGTLWEIHIFAYSPDCKLIATGSYNAVLVWNVEDSSRVLGPLTGLDGYVESVQFSPDGTRIVSSADGSRSNIVIWDVSDGRNVFNTLDGHRDSVYSVCYSPNGALIASGSGDKTIIIWNAHTGKKAIGPLTGHSHSVRCVSFSPDSTRLVSGSGDGTIRIWNVQTGEMMFELLHGHEDVITSVEYSPDGTRILSCWYDNSVRIHDARSPAERAQSRSETDIGDWTMNKDGWVVDDQSRLLVWVPGDLRKALMWSETWVMIAPQGYARLKFDKSRMGESWARSYTSGM